ncbi:acetolactate synthase [Nocardia mangyaensis]|uniref:acetolactate synthase n=1 Tax=Nocardia mangyaensis TaxID=2213200 RepID=A0A1J0W097_9NOCA|nr:thiamine pyrophosphate-binding protein [Nocardia mangyaensis]APE37740.1 acetolactate synthase [Nocardia mangyaensis]
MPDRVVDYLVGAVADLGITQIFGVDGANIEDLYDAIFDAGGHPAGIVAKHEFSAATMADGYARSTGGLGVVAATSGGGAMNLVAGLAESYASRVPVLALVGQAPTVLEGLGAFQDSSGLAESPDAAALFATISRYCARITDPAELPAQLAAALAAARGGGPAVLLLPKDVQQQSMPTDSGAAPGVNSHAPTERRQRTVPTDALASPELDERRAALRRVADDLTAARALGTVVVIAGDQVARDNARAELAELVSMLDATIGVAPDAKDVYPATGPGYSGVAGSMGHPELVAALESASVCLLVGTRLPVPTRAGLESALTSRTLLSLGVLAPYLPTAHAPSTDLAADITWLLGQLDPAPSSSSASTPTPLPVPETSGPGLRYRTVVEAIQTALPARADIFADAGNTGAAVVHHLRVPEGGRFVVALGMGGMGYAFGAGIGSAFARHDATDGRHRTVVIAGDGAFYMHGMEIHTAVEHALPITFVVFNNNAHAMCVTREQLYYRDRYSFNRFHTAHLGAGIAAMFPGLPAHTVTEPAELADALHHSFTAPGPAFLEIVCDPDEVPPFLPFLSTIESARSSQ